MNRKQSKTSTVSILRKGTMSKKNIMSRIDNEKNFSFSEHKRLKVMKRAKTFA